MGRPRVCSTPSWGPALRDPAHIIWFFMRLACVWVSNSKTALTTRFLGIRAEWLWSQRCVLSWILMTTADFILPPFSLSGNPLQKSILYLFFICMLCEFYWPQPKKVLSGFGFLAVYETVWNSGCRLKKWLPVTTRSNYSFPTSPLYTPASLNLGFCFLSFFLKNAWVHVCAHVHTWHSVCVWKPEGSHGSQFSFYHLGPSGRLGGDTSPSEPSHWSLLIFFLRKSSHILHWPEAHYVADNDNPELLLSSLLRLQVCITYMALFSLILRVFP